MQTSSTRASSPNLAKSPDSIEPETLFHSLVSGRRIVVVDVRDAAEMERSPMRFPEALWIPAHQLFVRRAELPGGKIDGIVTIASDAGRAKAAAFTLSLLGFTDVRSLKGGIEAWAAKGLPVA